MDLYTLQVIWFVILCALSIGFVILDGLNMGVCTLLPFICKNEQEKRVLINSIGPVWESNQVWLILGGGVVFAAWPLLYATVLSCLYIPIFIILFSLIIRPVAFKFRGKIESIAWRKIWDTGFFLSGAIPAFLLGIIVYNILTGLPFYLDHSFKIFYKGNFSDLFSISSLIIGIFSTTIILLQGAAYIQTKTKDMLANRANVIVFVLMPTINIMFLSILLMKCSTIYLNKIILVISMICFLIRYIPFRKKVIQTSIIISIMISTIGFLSFPIMLRSTIDPSSTLTISNASSSQKTLMIMLVSVILLLPIVLYYIKWLYKVFEGKLDYKSSINKDSY